MDALPINRMETSAVIDRVPQYNAEQCLEAAAESLNLSLAIVRAAPRLGGLGLLETDQAKRWIEEVRDWLDTAERKLG